MGNPRIHSENPEAVRNVASATKSDAASFAASEWQKMPAGVLSVVTTASGMSYNSPVRFETNTVRLAATLVAADQKGKSEKFESQAALLKYAVEKIGFSFNSISRFSTLVLAQPYGHDINGGTPERKQF
jgi:hypothetical protein